MSFTETLFSPNSFDNNNKISSAKEEEARIAHGRIKLVKRVPVSMRKSEAAARAIASRN